MNFNFGNIGKPAGGGGAGIGGLNVGGFGTNSGTTGGFGFPKIGGAAPTTGTAATAGIAPTMLNFGTNKAATTTSFQSPTTNSILGASSILGGGTPSIGGATSTLSLPPAASSAPSKPSIDTKGVQYSPISVQTQSPDGRGNLLSIVGQDKFNGYSLTELRVFDYINNQKISELPPPPPAPAVAVNSATAISFPSITSTKTTTAAGGSTIKGFDTTKSFQAQDSNEAKLTDAEIANAQNLPILVPAKISTASEFFKPNLERLKKSQRTEISLKHEELHQYDDYSIFFRPKSTSLRSKAVVTPIVVSANLLKCGAPVEASTKKFEPPSISSDDTERFANYEKIYKFFPPLKEIFNQTRVQNFRIVKEDVATIDFLMPVNISNINFDKDIVMRQCIVDIYRIKKAIPAEGNGLNVKAMIVMNNVWPKNPSNGVREKIRNAQKSREYELTLKEYCSNKNAQFVFYIPEQGIFQFIVPNFICGPFDIP